MTTYTDKGPKPDNGKFLQFDHVTFYVGNAKQAASYYVTRLGFQPVAYKGLETGSRKYAYHVVRQNQIVFVFVSTYESDDEEHGNHLKKHGDGIKDVALAVENLDGIVLRAKAQGAKIVCDIWEESDFNGIVRFATIQTYGDTTHTFVDRNLYRGDFLPGFTPCKEDILAKQLLPAKLDFIDHVVGNQPGGQMESMVEWYENVLQFHRFWSIDDKQVHTEHSALRSIVMCNWEENVKVRNLEARGIEFLQIPSSYYDIIREKLQQSKVKIMEEISLLQELNILIDYDENGYLLQLFTKNLQDRPTLFLEIIQRKNFNGFGAGNFKALFQSIEMEQERRGNLN